MSGFSPWVATSLATNTLAAVPRIRDIPLFVLDRITSMRVSTPVFKTGNHQSE
jgi:hypothetical protein